MLRNNIKGVGVLSAVLGLCVLQCGCGSMKPRLVEANKSDQVAGCAQVQDKLDKNDRLLDLQLLHAYPAGVYDDFIMDAMKKARFDTSPPNLPNPPYIPIRSIVFVEDFGKPAILAPECLARLGVN